MTTIIIYKSQDGEFERFSCKGHAGYAKFGKDIVCAAVSVLTINTINSLSELAHEEMDIHTDERKGVIDCKFTKRLSKEGTLLMNSYILGLNGIVEDYGKKYLELKFKEV